MKHECGRPLSNGINIESHNKEWIMRASSTAILIRYCPFCQLDLYTLKDKTKGEKLYYKLYDELQPIRRQHHDILMGIATRIKEMTDEEFDKILD